ncbi:Protein-disulfide isomerase [Candidatus Rubidus massiliensis]|nr:Protein-disulfide isomerase [Candidatus Rubidus massiliensis]
MNFINKLIVSLSFLLIINAALSCSNLDNYTIKFGNPNAPHKITEYISFNCPHCVELFRDEFHLVKEKYIDTQKAYWTFCPIPNDLLTIRAMHCMEFLSNNERIAFLEVLLKEIDLENVELSSILMEKAMEILEKPVSKLRDKEYLSQTTAYLHAFEYVKSDNKIIAIPSINIDGNLFIKEIPEIKFIDTKIK